MNSPDMSVPVAKAETGWHPDVSIIIVSWNCREMLAGCLREVFASRLDVPFEVIVVDNASVDGTSEIIPRLFPQVRLLENTDNLGFAKANNQAFGLAQGRFLMLLNPDAFPSSPETFGRMLDFLRGHPEIAGAGCTLVHPNGSHQVGDAGFKPTLGNVLAYALGLSRMFPGRVGLFLGKVPQKTFWIDVDWICGAFFIVRRSIVDKVGGLDERYFLYGEDIEWGCRIRRSGYRLAYVVQETVIHIQGGTHGNGGAPERISTRWLDSLGFLFAEQNNGRHWFWFKAAMALGFVWRAAVYRVISVVFRRADTRRKSAAMSVYAKHIWALQRHAGSETTGCRT